MVPQVPEQGPSESDLLAELQRDVSELFRAEKMLSDGNIQNNLMDKWFGRMVEKHYHQVLRDLVRAGRVPGPEKGIKADSMFRWKG